MLTHEFRDGELEALVSKGFDPEVFAVLVQQYRSRELSGKVQGEVAAPRSGQISVVPADARYQHELETIGLDALYSGKVAMALLAGGMATRFGGCCKAVTDALPGRSYLGLHAQRLRLLNASLANGRSHPSQIPLVMMTSYFTDEVVWSHLEEHEHFGLNPECIRSFWKWVMPRLLPDGALYRDHEGNLGLYCGGHGDFGQAIAETRALQWLQEQGVEHILLCNVDNLGGSIDPVLLGWFIQCEKEMMAEVVRKGPRDAGGALAVVDGRTRLVEGFAFPHGFDQSACPHFNTNNLWMRCSMLECDYPLTWHAVRKTVNGGTDVIQFERGVSEITAHVDTEYVEVKREERFLPVKSRDDLALIQRDLARMFRDVA